MKNQVHEDNVHCVKWSIEILPDSQRLDLFRILCNTKGGQTIVLNIFVIKVLDQLCSLVNWSFEIIYFATDWDIISFMSYSVLPEPAVQPQAVLCFQRVLPCSLVTTPHQAEQLTPAIQPLSIGGISFLPLHWLFTKKPARILLLFRFARNEPRDGGELGRLTLPSPNSHFPNRASLNLTLCSLSVLSVLPFTVSLLLKSTLESQCWPHKLPVPSAKLHVFQSSSCASSTQ